MIHNMPVIQESKPHIYKYGILLSRNNYVDCSSFDALKRKKRHFSIFRWCRNEVKRPFGQGAPVVVSGWTCWLEFANRKWKKIDDQHDAFAWIGSPLKPMHLFFESGEQLKQWLGPKEVDSMFAELL